jgi:transposase-like protein
MENQEKTSPKYAPEVHERAVRMVFNHADQYLSQWEAITSIASKIGCSGETLRKWVRQTERVLIGASSPTLPSRREALRIG